MIKMKKHTKHTKHKQKTHTHHCHTPVLNKSSVETTAALRFLHMEFPELRQKLASKMRLPPNDVNRKVGWDQANGLHES